MPDGLPLTDAEFESLAHAIYEHEALMAIRFIADARYHRALAARQAEQLQDMTTLARQRQHVIDNELRPRIAELEAQVARMLEIATCNICGREGTMVYCGCSAVG